MTDNARLKYLFAALTLLLSPLVMAQTASSPAAKPANATGQCKDGTYSTAASKSGACRGHNGVKDWYAAAASSSSTASPSGMKSTSAPSNTSAPAASQQSAQSAVPSTTKPSAGSSGTKKGPKANLANTPQAPGGGPGLVWVNTSSNVYHCPGTDFYGKTKAGSYLSEADAKAKGARPDHGNACGK